MCAFVKPCWKLLSRVMVGVPKFGTWVVGLYAAVTSAFANALTPAPAPVSTASSTSKRPAPSQMCLLGCSHASTCTNNIFRTQPTKRQVWVVSKPFQTSVRQCGRGIRSPSPHPRGGSRTRLHSASCMTVTLTSVRRGAARSANAPFFATLGSDSRDAGSLLRYMHN